MQTFSLKPGEVLPLVRSLSGVHDPLGLYEKLCGGGQAGTLLLESGEIAPVKGEKSMVVARSAVRASCRGRKVELQALNPNGLSAMPWIVSRLGSGVVEKTGEGSFCVTYPPAPTGSEEERLFAPSPIDVLRALASSHRLVSGGADLGPLTAGVFSFDFIGVYERLPGEPTGASDWPDYEFWLPDRTIWINHGQKTATAVFHVFGGENALRSYNDATDAISRISGRLEATAEPEKAGPLPDVGGSGVAVDMDDAQFCGLVERMKQHIVAGDVFQIVPSRSFSTACSDPVSAYRRLRELNPSPYMFYVNSGPDVLFGASPETAVKVDGVPRRVEIRPIAGTRPRGKSGGAADADLDGRYEAELRMDEKELAEHMMLVDLARNDVARVSAPGTRRVDRLLGVDRYSHVMHLVSHVSGELRGDLDALAAYVATMNMGTLTGAPKIRAAELLRGCEAGRRGPYGGAVGYFTMDGRLDTCIVIRSAVVHDGTATVRAGAGVVYDSNPHAEADETRRKAQAVLQAILESRGQG
ncbi:MAG: anthranilate synthase component 1 [Myxococcota bacterium]|jgi:anthranilate synthase component 1